MTAAELTDQKLSRARKPRTAGRAEANSVERARRQSQGDWAEPAKEAEPGTQTGPAEETEPENWA